MKRTGRLRHRSPTNSRPSEDRALRDSYREANPDCEFRKWIPELSGFPVRASEVNHIFSVGRRPDLLSNLINLSARAHHQFFHEHLIDGRVISLFIKWKKGELDEAEIKQASGKFIAGILCADATIDWVQPYLEQLREAFP